MVAVAWESSRRFNGNGRLNGYVLWILHKRIVDWLRRRYGATRHNARRETVPFDAERHGGSSLDDDQALADDGRRLDRSALSAHALNQLALLELAIETDQGIAIVARELGVPSSIQVLRREARLQ
jgi:DNA-directed RNA polymerase specialized sigma24 family protein